MDRATTGYEDSRWTAQPAAAADALRPDRARAAAWLCSERVVAPGGIVSSWWNPDHPGYAYPEAATLWLAWAAWRRDRGEGGPRPEQVAAVADWLCQRVESAAAIGKRGHLYLFDTCLAANGLARAAGLVSPLQAARVSQAFRRAVDGVHRFLDCDRSLLPAPARPDRWSQRWGRHLDRGAALLLRAGRLLEREAAVLAARRIRERVGEPPSEYTHALLYAVEGELLFRACGEPAGPVDPVAAADGLAALQRPDGSLPAWADGSGGPRSDAAAQAIRVWCLVDRERHAGAAGRAAARLAACQAPAGGVEYAPGSADRNTWVTLFTDQALAWLEGRAEPLALL